MNKTLQMLKDICRKTTELTIEVATEMLKACLKTLVSISRCENILRIHLISFDLQKQCLYFPCVLYFVAEKHIMQWLHLHDKYHIFLQHDKLGIISTYSHSLMYTVQKQSVAF